MIGNEIIGNEIIENEIIENEMIEDIIFACITYLHVSHGPDYRVCIKITYL